MENMKVRSSDVEFILNDVTDIAREMEEVSRSINNSFNDVMGAGFYNEGFNKIRKYLDGLSNRYEDSTRVLKRFDEEINNLENAYSSKFNDIRVNPIEQSSQATVTSSASTVTVDGLEKVDALTDAFSTEGIVGVSLQDTFSGTHEVLGDVTSTDRPDDRKGEKLEPIKFDDSYLAVLTRYGSQGIMLRSMIKDAVTDYN